MVSICYVVGVKVIVDLVVNYMSVGLGIGMVGMMYMKYDY